MSEVSVLAAVKTINRVGGTIIKITSDTMYVKAKKSSDVFNDEEKRKKLARGVKHMTGLKFKWRYE